MIWYDIWYDGGGSVAAGNTHHLPSEQLSLCPVCLNMVVKQLKSDTNFFGQTWFSWFGCGELYRVKCKLSKIWGDTLEGSCKWILVGGQWPCKGCVALVVTSHMYTLLAWAWMAEAWLFCWMVTSDQEKAWMVVGVVNGGHLLLWVTLWAFADKPQWAEGALVKSYITWKAPIGFRIFLNLVPECIVIVLWYTPSSFSLCSMRANRAYYGAV